MRRLWVGVMVAGLFVAASPAGATAASQVRSPLMRFGLRSRSGYRIEVFASRQTVELIAARDERARRRGAFVSYLARAKVGGGAVGVVFAGLGRVSMRFVPSRGAPTVTCEESERIVTQSGLFIGSLRFQGESDFVDVDAQRAKGTLTKFQPVPSCPRPPSHPSPEPQLRTKVTSLYADFREGIDAVHFQAHTDVRGKAIYSVVDESGGGPVAIYRRAYAEASPLTFASDDALRFASVSPPYPFSGSGLIQRNANGSRSWTGSLAASFPGGVTVGLTGPQFKTQLLRQW